MDYSKCTKKELIRLLEVKEGKVVKNCGNPTDTYNFYLQQYGRKKQEYFLILTLNGALEVIKKHIISIGTLDSAPAHPREVFVKAIQDRAKAIVICHNHPSNSVKPSSEDYEVTGRLCRAGKIIGINIVDHIIVGCGDYYSFAENGEMAIWN